jgi:hypothetical protein
MKRKLKLHRETLHHLASSDLGAAQGGAIGRPTMTPQSCVYLCPVATQNFSCGGTCQITQCVHECPIAGTNPCVTIGPGGGFGG